VPFDPAKARQCDTPPPTQLWSAVAPVCTLLHGKFGQLPWPSDVPDVHSRVLLLLLGLSQHPLRTAYTHVDAVVRGARDDACARTSVSCTHPHTLTSHHCMMCTPVVDPTSRLTTLDH
jgi:hypothetical protein